MLLALAGETADYSLGRDLSLAEADRISELARRHGFEPAEPQWYGTRLTDADFRRVGDAVLKRKKAEVPAKVVGASWAAQ